MTSSFNDESQIWTTLNRQTTLITSVKHKEKETKTVVPKLRISELKQEPTEPKTNPTTVKKEPKRASERLQTTPKRHQARKGVESEEDDEATMGRFSPGPDKPGVERFWKKKKVGSEERAVSGASILKTPSFDIRDKKGSVHVSELKEATRSGLGSTALTRKTQEILKDYKVKPSFRTSNIRYKPLPSDFEDKRKEYIDRLSRKSASNASSAPYVSGAVSGTGRTPGRIPSTHESMKVSTIRDELSKSKPVSQSNPNSRKMSKIENLSQTRQPAERGSFGKPDTSDGPSRAACFASRASKASRLTHSKHTLQNAPSELHQSNKSNSTTRSQNSRDLRVVGKIELIPHEIHLTKLKTDTESAPSSQRQKTFSRHSNPRSFNEEGQKPAKVPSSSKSRIKIDEFKPSSYPEIQLNGGEFAKDRNSRSVHNNDIEATSLDTYEALDKAQSFLKITSKKVSDRTERSEVHDIYDPTHSKKNLLSTRSYQAPRLRSRAETDFIKKSKILTVDCNRDRNQNNKSYRYSGVTSRAGTAANQASEAGGSRHESNHASNFDRESKKLESVKGSAASHQTGSGRAEERRQSSQYLQKENFGSKVSDRESFSRYGRKAPMRYGRMPESRHSRDH